MGYSNHLPDKMKLQEVNGPCISGYYKQLDPHLCIWLSFRPGRPATYQLLQNIARAISVKVCPILLLGMTDIAQFL
jgi:hypothetical protein